MINLIRLELFKIFRKPRTYIAFGAVAGIIWIFPLKPFFGWINKAE